MACLFVYDWKHRDEAIVVIVVIFVAGTPIEYEFVGCTNSTNNTNNFINDDDDLMMDDALRRRKIHIDEEIAVVMKRSCIDCSVRSHCGCRIDGCVRVVVSIILLIIVIQQDATTSK